MGRTDSRPGWRTITWIAWLLVVLPFVAGALTAWAVAIADRTPMTTQPEGYFIVFPVMMDATALLAWAATALVVAIGATSRATWAPTGVLAVAVTAAIGWWLIVALNGSMVANAPAEPLSLGIPGLANLTSVSLMLSLHAVFGVLLIALAVLAARARKRCRQGI